MVTKARTGKQKVTLTPFEDAVHYQTTVSFKLRGMEVGAYLLKKSPQSPFVLTFGFECPGIHSFLPDSKMEKAFDLLESGVKDFPPHERITFHLGAYKSDLLRQEHLAKLEKTAPSDELRFLLRGERTRIRQLSTEGLREPKTLHIFVTYRTQKPHHQKDWLEKLLAKLEDMWHQFTGKAQRVKTANVGRFLRRAWGDGFIHWKQILESKLELMLRPLNAQEMWNYAWGRLNQPQHKPIDVPQKVVVEKSGLNEQIRSSVHGATLLLADSEPVFDRQWVHTGGQYVGILTFIDKPGGWKSKRHQLHYLWDVVARDLVTDTEIITQIVPADSRLLKISMTSVTKQSQVQAKRREKRDDIDVGAQLKARRGVEAQERLLSGEIPFYTATIILVRRKNLEDLEEACRYIENCFHRPAWVVRERQIAWKLWLQALMIVDENLLAMPFIQRRQLYLSSELPGLIPIVKTHSRDKEGLELIGEDGGTPIFIDLFSPGNDKHRHIGVFGTTRSGKSVLVGGILTQALARSIPVVAIDYPKADGSSTYTTYTWFMEERGAYFDVGKESVNLFDRPNLSALPLEKQSERFEDYKDFLCSCLQVMIVGESDDILLNQTVRTVLYQTLNRFFADEKILERYQAAETQGLRSAAWKQMPTLKDFLAYLQELIGQNFFENLIRKTNVVSFSGQSAAILPKALEQIVLRIQYWTESRVGRAISSPSSVQTEAPLMVMALRQISENEDAAILSLVAYAAALRRAMAFPISIFFIDESPILFKFPSVVGLVASLISNGAKSGIRVILSAQDPNTISNSKSGQQIFQNINTRLIGKIQPSAISSFETILSYESELVSRCASFYPKRHGIYTQWLLDDNGTIAFCRYYAPVVQLGLVANNSDEQEIREKFLQKYPDKYEALAYFSEVLAESIQTDKDLKVIAARYLSSPVAA